MLIILILSVISFCCTSVKTIHQKINLEKLNGVWSQTSSQKNTDAVYSWGKGTFNYGLVIDIGRSTIEWQGLSFYFQIKKIEWKDENTATIIGNMLVPNAKLKSEDLSIHIIALKSGNMRIIENEIGKDNFGIGAGEYNRVDGLFKATKKISLKPDTVLYQLGYDYKFSRIENINKETNAYYIKNDIIMNDKWQFILIEDKGLFWVKDN